MAAEQLLDGEAQALTRKAVELALAGDTVALKLCLERILPIRRGRPVPFALPPIESVSDLPAAMAAVVAAVAEGTLTPEEAASISAILEAQRRAVETAQLEQRIALLEATRGERV
jgi:hypothetical protein